MQLSKPVKIVLIVGAILIAVFAIWYFVQGGGDDSDPVEYRSARSGQPQ